MAQGASATLTLQGVVDAGAGGSTITNTTTAAAGDQTDPTNFGDDLTEEVVVNNFADLVTVKTLASGDDTPDEGDTVTFQIVVTNLGEAAATNVSLTDLLPTGLTATMLNGNVTQGTYDAATGLFSVGDLARGASATLTLQGTVDVGQAGNTITNVTTAAAGDQTDPSIVGDDLEEEVVVNNIADLVTVKTLTSGNSIPNEGDTVTFQIEVTNNGAAAATGVSLTDFLPTGLTATMFNGTVTQGSYDAATGLFDIGALAQGASATLTLEGVVDVGQAGSTIVNTTTAAVGDQTDPSIDGDDLVEEVTVNNVADLVTVKTLTSGDDTPDVGDTVTFQIVVTNNGIAGATNVSLTDLLPAGLTATALNGNVTQGTYDAATGLFDIGDIARGASVTLTLQGTVDAGQGGNTITNVTTAAAGDQTDPSTVGDDLEEAVTVNEAADLVTVKTLTSGNPTPDEGDTVTFQIEVVNNGSSDATNVTLTDLLPAGLTATAFNGGVSQGSYDSTTGVFTIGDLGVNATATLTLQGTVDAGESGNTITNVTTAATGDQTDPSTAGDDLEEAIVVGIPAADLVTVKTLASETSTPDEGDVVTFEIAVTNNGPDVATNVSLIDFLPAGLTATANNGTTATVGGYDPVNGVWTIGTLASGATVTLTLEGTVDVGEGGNAITNVTTAAAGDQVDPTTVGDDLEEEIIVNDAANLVTVKTLASTNSTPTEGDTVIFQIAVVNNGGAQATNVSLTDSLPAGITYTANTTTQGTYDPATGVWTIGTLDDGAVATITLTGTVDVGQAGNTITNVTTAATGDQTDPTTAGDDLDEAVVVDNTTDLVTVKTLVGSNNTPDEGDTVTFDITVTNNGPLTATNVDLTDLLPAGLTATAINGGITQGSYDSATGLFSIGTLLVGESATLTLEGTVDAGQGGNTITNITTAATGDQTDPSTIGDDLEEAVVVEIPTADLVTVKTLASGNGTPDEGDIVTFEIAVTNNGPDAATNISLIDFLPAGLTATANNGTTATAGAYDPVTGVWSIGTLASGATVVLTLEGTVDVGEGGNTITNITTAAAGDQFDPSTMGDDLEETVVVNDAADLVTVKTLTSGNPTPSEGDTVTFQIAVVNNGAAQATNVSLTDQLPAGITLTGGLTSQGAYDTATGLWTIGTLNNGDAATITLTGTVDAGQGGNTITNVTTAATGDQMDPSTVGDDLVESVDVQDNTTDLVTVKTLAGGNSTPEEGDTVTFDITVTNNGPSDATNVDLTDLLPAGLTATALNGGITQGSYDATTGIFSIGTLLVGQSATLTLEGTVDAGQGGNTITNITTAATGDQVDPSTVGDDLEEAIIVGIPAADLVTVKTLASGNPSPDEGNVVTFEIAVTNNGPDTATNVSLVDFLPAGLTATANNGVSGIAGAYDPVTGVWSIGTLASGTTVVLTLEGTVDVGQGGNTITNVTTAAAGDQVDLSTAGDDLEEAVTVNDAADLVTVKTLASGNNTPDEGDTVTFQIAVVNNGAAQATNVSLTDSLPAGITYTANTTSQGTYDPTTGLWTIGTLNNGDVATITLTGTVDAGQGGNTITNVTTAATGDQTDPSTVGDDLDESVVVGVPTADLVTVKTLLSGDDTPDEGDTVTFQIEITNNGTSDATGVFLNDFLPPGLTATASNGTVSQGSYSAASGIFGIGDIAVGDTATLILEGTVDVGQGGNTITNITTAATGDQVDPSTVGDDLEESVVVNDAADLVTVKTLSSSDDTPAEGDTVTFQIAVVNNGAAQATNVSLTDSLPAGFTLTGNTTSQGTYAGGVWTIGTLNVGDVATITLTGTIDAGQGGNTITNVTTAATGDQTDPTTVGDDLEESVVVEDNTTDLVTVKTLASGNPSPEEGDTVTFDITVTNSGPADATNVDLTDLLPAGLTATTLNGGITQGSYDPATGLFSIGTLLVGQSATLTLEGTVDAGQGGNIITNITTAATGDQVDPSTVGDDLEETVAVGVPTTDLVTVKTLLSPSGTPDEGDVVTFQIQVTNTGPDDATGVSLVDLLPAGLTATANNGSGVISGAYNATTGLWSIGTLASGATATLILEGTVDVGQGGNTITNITTAATGDQVDLSTVGDDLEEAVVVNNAADLVTVKTLASGNSNPAEGDVVTFQIAVVNNGAAQATNVSLTDSLPAGITYTANTTSQGTYDPTTGLWTIGTLNNGDVATITLTGTVDAGQGGNTITNVTTAATGDQTDPSTVGDDLDESVVVGVPTADLVTVKTLLSGDDTPDEGDTVTFQIEITNNGTSDATGVFLNDLLPPGLTATTNNGTVSQGSYSSVSGIFGIGDIAVGDTATLILEGTVDVGQGGNTITNVTTAATGDQTDPTTAGDDLGESVVVNVPQVVNADIAVAKQVFGAPVQIANGNFDVVYELVVENTGDVDLANLSLIEDFAIAFGNVAIGGGEIFLTTPPSDPASTIVTNLNLQTDVEIIDQSQPSLLAAGDSFVVRFTIQIDPDAAGAPTLLNNQVTVTGDAVDSNGDPILDGSGDPITATDLSDSGATANSTNPGADGDSGGSDDPTPLLIADIGLAKEVTEVFNHDDHFDVSFRLLFENNGNVDLTNLSIFDDIASEFGPAFIDINDVFVQNFVGTGTAPTVNAAWATDTTQSIISGGQANVGDSFEVVFVVGIDIIAGNFSQLTNQATAQGVGIDPDTGVADPALTAFSDSDNGADPNGENGEASPDGVFANDPTPIEIADIAIAKSIVGEPVLNDQGFYVVSFQAVVANTGNVDLAQVSVVEDLSTQFGPAFVNAGNLTITSGPSESTSNIVVNSAGFNGSGTTELLDSSINNVLVYGDSFTVQFDVEIDPTQVTGSLVNQIQGNGVGVDASGAPILGVDGNQLSANDLSDSGTDPTGINADDPSDQGTLDDPTLFDPLDVPLSTISGTVFQDDNNDGIQDAGEVGIAGVEIVLTGTDVYGNPVEATVFTDANGVFSFDGLVAGTYTVTQIQPAGFDDGIDIGAPSVTVGNDVFSNIQLGFGDVVTDNTFGEVVPVIPPLEPVTPEGAAGNPPRLPGFLPPNLVPIGNQVSFGTPGPIYSGIPINQNSNPLTLDSGRAVTGGYSVSNGFFNEGDIDCGCECECDCGSLPPVDACGNPIMAMPVEQIIDDGCGCGPIYSEGEVPMGAIDAQMLSPVIEQTPEVFFEGASGEEVDGDQVDQIDEEIVKNEDSDRIPEPSFLKRFSSWIAPKNDIKA